MPNSMKDEHLDDICAQCKKPHGHNIVLQMHNFKVYELITCVNCGYENVRLKPEEPLGSKADTFDRIKT